MTDQDSMNPMGVVCYACGAQVGKRCTAPTDTSRRPVDWFHLVRSDLAQGWDGFS